MPAQVSEQQCTGCESCVAECPSEAIGMVGDKAVVDVEELHRLRGLR